jgi:hypothetical protein
MKNPAAAGSIGSRAHPVSRLVFVRVYDSDNHHATRYSAEIANHLSDLTRLPRITHLSNLL